MSLHIPLSYVDRYLDLAGWFYHRYLSAMRLRYDFRIVDMRPLAFFWCEDVEVRAFKRFNRRKHAYGLLWVARLDRLVYAAISADLFITLKTHTGAIKHKLGPTLRVHWPKGNFEWQVPVHGLDGRAKVAWFEWSLTSTTFIAAWNVPVLTMNEFVF